MSSSKFTKPQVGPIVPIAPQKLKRQQTLVGLGPHQDRVMRRPEVELVTGLSRSSIYRGMANDDLASFKMKHVDIHRGTVHQDAREVRTKNAKTFTTVFFPVGHHARVCRTPEHFKAWSQNLGHEAVLTTFMSYGTVSTHRQAELIQSFGTRDANKDELKSTLLALAAKL